MALFLFTAFGKHEMDTFRVCLEKSGKGRYSGIGVMVAKLSNGRGMFVKYQDDRLACYESVDRFLSDVYVTGTAGVALKCTVLWFLTKNLVQY